MSLASNDLLRTISNNNPQNDNGTRLAKIVSYQATTRSVYVTFYGETEQSSVPYKVPEWMTGSMLAPGSVVVLIKVNGSYVVMGRL